MDEEFEGIPKPGDQLLGKYRVERMLGQGGMGVVVAARHLSLDQMVAIKFLLAKAARNPKAVARFTREAQAAARIHSEHVARVSDIGTMDDGAPYMVMEYLEGEDLSERLARGPLPMPQAVQFLVEACEALAEAHKANIIHRDLKPANLFVARRPDGSEAIKVLDFGISKILDEGIDDLTKTSALMGSPLYMSPEQMLNVKTVDPRTDVWSLGCILFEAVAGRPPYLANTLPELCAMVVSTEPATLRQVLPDASPAFEAAVGGALQKQLDHRYPNVATFAQAIAPFGPPEALKSAETSQRILGVAASSSAAHDGPYPAHRSGAYPARAGSSGSYPVQAVAPPIGASTASPVSNTMPEAGLARSSGTVVSIVAAVGALLLAGAAFVGYQLLQNAASKDGPRQSTVTTAAAASTDRSSGPVASSATSSAASSADSPASSASATTAVPATATARVPPHPVVTTRPPSDNTKRPGDHLFNKRTP